MTNKELSQTIRNDLKAAGYTNKDIGVRVKDCGYSTSAYVTVKNPNINKKEIAQIVKHHNDFEIDQRTQEILEGGNTYIFIDYADGIFDEVSKPYMSEAEKLINKDVEVQTIKENIYFIHDGINYMLRDQNPGMFGTRYVANVEELATYLFKIYNFNSIIL